MADWKDRLRPASFRGVPFLVVGSALKGGRRAVVHEFPQRERPFVEDTGRKAEKYPVEAIILGDDYLEVRDRLVARLRQRPAGFPFRAGSTLSHPYWGLVEVVPESWEIKETSPEGRMARVAITFVEAGKATGLLEARTDSAVGVDAQGTAAIDAAGDQAVLELVTTAVAEAAREAIENETTSLGRKLEAALGQLTGAAADVEALADDVVALINNAVALATTPADLVAKIQVAVKGVFAAAVNGLEAFYVYSTLFGITPVQVGGAGATSSTANANARLVADLAAVAIVAGSAGAAARAAWVSQDDATEARDLALAELDRLLDGTPDDRTLRELRRLRALVVSSVPRPGQDLPRVASTTLHSTEPGLVVSWRLYADASRGEEIAERNRLPYPGLLPGGVALEVLSA